MAEGKLFLLSLRFPPAVKNLDELGVTGIMLFSDIARGEHLGHWVARVDEGVGF